MTVTVDADRQRTAQRYAVIRRVISVVELAVGVAYLGVILGLGWSPGLRDLASGGTAARAGQVAATFLALFVGYSVLTLPLTIYSGWRLPRRFGLSVQSFGQWCIDWLKGTGLALALGLVIVEAVYALLLAIPGWWWLATAALYLVLTVGLAILAPVLLLPLFFKLTPLDEPDLVARLEALARRAGAKVRGVYRMNLSEKTTAANAALMGLGNTRRIVLGDTLLNHYPPAEIEAVFAHELGHHVHRDVPRMVATQTVLTLVGLYVCNLALQWGARTLGYASVADPATMPFLALVLGAFGFVSAPVSNYLSRKWERAADWYALETTRDPEAFSNAMIRLANQNLAEYDPPRWVEVLYYDHPAIAQRVRLAQEYAHQRG